MKVAAIQMCSSPHVSENLNAAEALIAEAAKGGAKLVVLPEMFATLGSISEKLAAKEVFGQGVIQQFLAEQSQKHAIWIVGGTIPISTQDPNKVRAASLVYNDSGTVAARYDKIHLFRAKLSEQEQYDESKLIEAGDTPTTVDTPIGKIGLAVCYDLRFPHLFQSYAQEGAEVMVISAAFTRITGQAHWEVLLRARAIETLSYVVGAAQGGCHQSGKETFGHTMIISPWGEVLAEQTHNEPGVAFANIDLAYLFEVREKLGCDDGRIMSI